MAMDLGPVGLWTFHLDLLPVSAAQELLVELEGLGYGTVWIPEAMGRDPIAHSALLLAATLVSGLAARAFAGMIEGDGKGKAANNCLVELSVQVCARLMLC